MLPMTTASCDLGVPIAGFKQACIAQQIAEYRKEHGRFDNRQSFGKVPRLGGRTYRYEQSARLLACIQNGF